MKVGVVLPTADADAADGASWLSIRDLARHAESAGLDSVWVADHFLIRIPGMPDEGLQEAWSTLSAIAATTDRIELGTLVTAASFRPPAVLAKVAATTDEISGGRLTLGIGCGWHEAEMRTFGFPSDHRVARFEEAVRIIAPLLRGDRVTLHGQWHRVDDAILDPSPGARANGSRIMLLIAAVGPRMLRLAARWADAWNTNGYGWPDRVFSARLDTFLRACELERRDPATIEVTAGIEVAWDPRSRARPSALPPEVSAIADALAAWEAQGVRHVQVSVLPMSSAGVELLAEAVAQSRTGRAWPGGSQAHGHRQGPAA